jgi:hypothetical protein
MPWFIGRCVRHGPVAGSGGVGLMMGALGAKYSSSWVVHTPPESVVGL